MNKENPYKTSRDYKRLKDLLDKGYRIVCFIDYKGGGSRVLRDVCTANCLYRKEYYFVSRGIIYMIWGAYDKLTFEEICKAGNVEFIDIEEE